MCVLKRPCVHDAGSKHPLQILVTMSLILFMILIMFMLLYVVFVLISTECVNECTGCISKDLHPTLYNLAHLNHENKFVALFSTLSHD